MKLHILDKSSIDEIVSLTKQLNPNTEINTLKKRHAEMFTFQSYRCFGLFDNNTLIAVSSGWITVKLYSGKQLEIDNVIVDSSIQSKGYGKVFLNKIENWAKEEGCETIELNAYSQNNRAHKFYFKHGYEILGFHFQKKIKT